MQNTSKRNVIVSALLVIAMCVSLMAGATFALFTSESKVNVAVTSGKVKVTATASEPQVGTTLSNPSGFSATATGNEIVFDKIMPGDYATFTITIHNESDVAVQYRTVIAKETDDGLFAGLTVEIDGVTYDGATKRTEWTRMEVGCDDITVSVKVSLPKDAGNAYQEKSCSFSYKVEAVQGNAEMPKLTAPSTVTSGSETTVSGEGDVQATVSAELSGALAAAGFESVSLAYTQPKVDAESSTVTFESVELVDDAENVIDLSSYTGKITVTLPVTGIADGTVVTVFHDGAYITSATVTDGKIAYETEHLCKIEVRVDCTYVNTFDELSAAVNDADCNKIILGSDITNETVPHTGGTNAYDPYGVADTFTLAKGRNLTIDFNGHVLTTAVRLFYVKGGATLTLENSDTSNKQSGIYFNKTDSDPNYAKNSYGIYLEIERKNQGSEWWTESVAVLNIEKNVTLAIGITEGGASPTGMIWNCGKINMNGGELIAYSTVAVYIFSSAEGEFIMNDGKITLADSSATGILSFGNSNAEVKLIKGSIEGAGTAYEIKNLSSTYTYDISDTFVINTTKGPNT